VLVGVWRHHDGGIGTWGSFPKRDVTAMSCVCLGTSARVCMCDMLNCASWCATAPRQHRNTGFVSTA